MLLRFRKSLANSALRLAISEKSQTELAMLPLPKGLPQSPLGPGDGNT